MFMEMLLDADHFADDEIVVVASLRIFELRAKFTVRHRIEFICLLRIKCYPK